MSNKKTIFQFAKFAQLNAKLKQCEETKFAISIEMGEVLNVDIPKFKTDEGKEYYKTQGNPYPTIEEFIKGEYKIEKSWAYKIMKAAKIDTQTRKNYEAMENAQGNTCSIAKFIKFAEGGESEGEGEGEGEVKEPKAKPQMFKASCSAKGDIKISGTISKEFATMLIEEIKKAIK